MRQKHLEMRKAQAVERIEKKLDLIGKALNLDFSAIDGFTPEQTPEPTQAETTPEQTPEPTQAETTPEQTPEPEAKPRKK